MSRVAVLGIGPSGLAAAWAALRAGYDVTFYSQTIDKSTLFGCQYLHQPIPLPPSYKIQQTRVEYKISGTPEEYRAKVYGAAWDGTVSPEDLAGEHDAWDIRATYDALFDIVRKRRQVDIVAPVTITHGWLMTHVKELSSYAHVISTIPAIALCENPAMLPKQTGHLFRSHEIKAAGSPVYAPDLDDVVRCDGTPFESWYRKATVFGHTTVEWPRTTRNIPEKYRAVKVRKPLSNECDCHPEIIRMGRYGAWTKGVLVHDVYNQTGALMRGEWPA